MRTSRTRHSAATVVTAASAFLLLTAGAVATAPSATAGTPGGTRADDRNCDFNGDGYEDLLIGAPGASVAGSENAGLVSVQYGSGGGLDTRHARVFTRNSPGVEGSPGLQDRFGAAVASGDLDADGYDDAIIGIPGDDYSAVSNAGGVIVLWGSPNGLSSPDSVWVAPPAPAADGHFGTSLAAARLSGATSGDVLAVLDRQDVRLLTFEPQGGDTGGAGGLTPADRGAGAPLGVPATPLRTVGELVRQRGRVAQRLDPPVGLRRGVPDGARANGIDRVDGTGWMDGAPAREPATREPATGARAQGTGAREDGRVALAPVSLTVGDYDANGYSDLVISGVTAGVTTGAGTAAGGEATAGDAGAADDLPGRGWSAYLAGGAEGPVWARDLRGGPAAASGDVNGDGYDDLVTGEPRPVDDAVDEAGQPTGGVVAVHYGGPAGPGPDSDTPVQYWTQNSPHIPGVPESGDAWGADLSVGDTNGDGYADVAIGAPGEDRLTSGGATVRDAGSVTVLRGTEDGLTGSGARSWSQDTIRIPGTVENGDQWGAQVRLLDPDGNRRFDLVSGAPGENDGDGAIWVLPATSSGITPTGSWTYGLGFLGSAHLGAEYGATVDE